MTAPEPPFVLVILDGGPLMIGYLVMVPVWITVSVMVIRARLGADFLWMPPLGFLLLAFGIRFCLRGRGRCVAPGQPGI